MADRGVFLVNLMGSPGSGKTSLLAALLPLLSPPLRAAVIEADLDSRIDADALEARGWKAVQLRTGGFCHLDAFMVRRGLSELGIPPPEAGTPSPFDIVFIENVGNLICTAQGGYGGPPESGPPLGARGGRQALEISGHVRQGGRRGGQQVRLPGSGELRRGGPVPPRPGTRAGFPDLRGFRPHRAGTSGSRSVYS
ncbi:MAG: hypothetical protein MZV70_06100 [Desulfobacterales bacterium]|nr:hypothetical protein [Desulfobacterales bacterium]